MHVADTESTADDRLRHDLIREADARRPIAMIGMDEGAIVSAAVLRLDQSRGGGIEIAELIVLLEMRRAVFVAHAEVQCELVIHLPIVLQISEMHVLLQVRNKESTQGILCAQAE